MKKIKESNILVILTSFRAIIDTFTGPFLAAYFVSSTMESLSVLAKYYLIVYFFCAVSTFPSAHLSQKGKLHIVFSAGVTVTFLSILFIAVMKEKLPSYYYILGTLYGISAQLYYFPFNTFSLSKIKDHERLQFENKRILASKITSIVIPVVLGSVITSSDYTRTAILILIVSVASIICSFFITKVDATKKIDYRRAFSIIRNSPCSRKLMRIQLGVGFYTVLPNFVFAALIFMNNKSNLGLGYLTSLSALLTILGQFLYIIFKKTNDKIGDFVLTISPLIVVLTLLSYCLFPNLATISVSYVAYTVFNQLREIPGCARRYIVLYHTQQIAGNDEALGFAENFLGLGRCLGLIVMLIALRISIKLVPWVFFAIMCVMIPNSINTKNLKSMNY